MTDGLGYSLFAVLLVKNQERQREGMNLGVMTAMGKDCMWLMVGVKVLSNRQSSMYPWQCLYHIRGVIP